MQKHPYFLFSIELHSQFKMLSKQATKEWNLLNHCCQAAILNTTNSASLEEVDWDKIITLARHQQIIPLFYKGLLIHRQQSAIPAKILQQLKSINFQIIAKNLNYLKELLTITQLARKEGIEMIPLKGLILAIKAFDNIGLRVFSDMDVLLPASQLDKLGQLLTNRDYQILAEYPEILKNNFLSNNCEYSYSRYKNNQRIFTVDAHWLIGQKMYQINLNFDKILELTTLETHYQTSINTLTPTGLLLTTCLHHTGKDQMNLLKQVYDVAAILGKFEKEIDWSLFLSKISEWKVENLVLVGIGIAQEFCPSNLPTVIHQKLATKKLKKQIQSDIAKLKYTVLASTSKTGTSNSSILGHFWYHIKLRKYYSTKFKIIYYGLLHIVTPTIIDLEGKNVSRLEFYWFALMKPFRLLKKDKSR